MGRRTIGIGARMAVLAVILAMVALSGCTATAQGTAVRASGQAAQVRDVSSSGRLDYACALAIDAKSHHGPVRGWNIAVGDDADPVLHEVAGASGLLGAVSGAHVAHHRDLSKAAETYYSGLTRLDTTRMQQGLDGLVSGCRRSDLPAQQPDVSAAGRIRYACALATDVQTNGGPVENWIAIGDDAGPATFELGGAVGLLGVWTASHVKGHRNLSEAAADIMDGIVRFQTAAIRHGMRDLVRGCADL